MNSDSCRNISVVCLYKVLMIQTFAHETSFSPTQFQSLRSHIPDSVSISQTTVPSSALFAPLFYFQDGVEGNQVLTLISERKYPECSACEPRPFTVLPRGCCQHRKYPGGTGAAGSSYAVMRGAQGPRAYCREAQLSIRPPWNF